MISHFNIDNDEMGAMVGAVDLDGKALDAVVAQWMSDNEGRWQDWIQ